MEGPCQAVFTCIPAFCLSLCKLSVLTNGQQTLEGVQQHVSAVYRAVQRRVNGLRVRSDLYGQDLLFGTPACIIGTFRTILG